MASKKEKETQTPIDVLNEKGSVVIAADTRKDAYGQSAAIVAAIPADKQWTRGIVQYHFGETPKFTQEIRIVN